MEIEPATFVCHPTQTTPWSWLGIVFKESPVSVRELRWHQTSDTIWMCISKTVTTNGTKKLAGMVVHSPCCMNQCFLTSCDLLTSLIDFTEIFRNVVWEPTWISRLILCRVEQLGHLRLVLTCTHFTSFLSECFFLCRSSYFLDVPSVCLAPMGHRFIASCTLYQCNENKTLVYPADILLLKFYWMSPLNDTMSKLSGYFGFNKLLPEDAPNLQDFFISVMSSV